MFALMRKIVILCGENDLKTLAKIFASLLQPWCVQAFEFLENKG